jgi:hypothetical protein
MITTTFPVSDSLRSPLESTAPTPTLEEIEF